MDARLFAKAMETEARLAEDYAAGLNALQRTIGRHDWEEVEKRIAALRALAGAVEQAEEARARVFQELKVALLLPAEAGFEQAAEKLPPAEGEQLRELHRRLKIAVIRVKGSSGLLGYYVRSALEARRQVLEELFPHRKGRLYSRSGRARASADESLMLDHRY